ncbi:MAG: hypothetical protein IPP43_15240 [Chitinophagaceae bacterium]|nr:hypothetical protein [Chitinophagaceae bacterium]
MYRSTDFGSTWTVITNTNHASYQSWYSHLVTPYPVAGGTSTTKLFMAGVNRYVLTIAGSTGTATSIGTGSQSMAVIAPGGSEGTNYLHADVHDVQFLPGSLTTAFFCN